MARVKSENLPVYAKNDSKFWQTPGLTVKAEPVKFNASVGEGAGKQTFELTASVREVSFGGNLETAVAALGSIGTVLTIVEDHINDYLAIQAKNAVKNDQLSFEKKVADGVSAAIAKFTSDRGNAPTDEQVGKIRAKVRARLEELERIQKETVDLSDM